MGSVGCCLLTEACTGQHGRRGCREVCKYLTRRGRPSHPIHMIMLAYLGTRKVKGRTSKLNMVWAYFWSVVRFQHQHTASPISHVLQGCQSPVQSGSHLNSTKQELDLGFSPSRQLNFGPNPLWTELLVQFGFEEGLSSEPNLNFSIYVKQPYIRDITTFVWRTKSKYCLDK